MIREKINVSVVIAVSKLHRPCTHSQQRANRSSDVGLVDGNPCHCWHRCYVISVLFYLFTCVIIPDIIIKKQ